MTITPTLFFSIVLACAGTWGVIWLLLFGPNILNAVIIMPIGGLLRLLDPGRPVSQAKRLVLRKFSVHSMMQEIESVAERVRELRAGDMISRVEGPIVSRRTRIERAFAMPSACPECGSEGKRGKPVLPECACPAQIVERLPHFVSREAMDIDGFGDNCAAYFAPHLATLADLYAWTPEFFAAHPAMLSAKQSAKLMAAIDASRDRGLARVLFAVGIPNVDIGTAQRLAEAYPSLGKLLKATQTDLVSIPDIGPMSAESIYTFITNAENIAMLQDLQDHGVDMTHRVAATTSTALAGKSFVITGTLSIRRDEMARLIAAAGGKISRSVTKTTRYLVAGDDSGSKLDKAKSLGVGVLSESDVYALIEGNG